MDYGEAENFLRDAKFSASARVVCLRASRSGEGAKCGNYYDVFFNYHKWQVTRRIAF